MFKILGLLSLSSAYALSVMYLAGVKLSDGQATAQGALSAALFFMISQAAPLPTLAPDRPHPSVFTPYAMLSLAGQAAAHVSLLAWAHSRADALMGADPDARAPDADFAPNLVNTTAYLVNVQLMLATFGANYVGAPFCTPLSAAKPLARTLLYGSLAVAALMLGVVPGAERALSLVRIPYPLAPSLVAACAADFAACVVWERALRAALPARRPRLLAGGVGGGGGEGRAKRD
jgi:cation-transporting ATPase 13A1